MKILAVVNARSNYACLKTALQAIEKHPDLTLRIVCGGSSTLQEYGKVSSLMKSEGFHVEHELYSMVRGDLPQSMVRSMGLSAIDLSQIFAKESPDAVLIVGDRFETLAAAVTASYMNVPLIHVQGGERSGSIDEKIRHAITKLADLHFPSTQRAGRILAQMGEDPKSIHVVGCPSVDLLTSLPPIDREALRMGSGHSIDVRAPYLVVLQHPVTTEADCGTLTTLKAVKAVGMQTIWLYPNIDSGSDKITKLLRQHGKGKIRYFRNFPPEQYAALINQCACLIGNSSSALRSGAYLGVPAVNIGQRQKNRESADNVFKLFAVTIDSLTSAIKIQIEHGKYESSNLYGSGNAGEQIADIISKTELTHTKVLNEI